MLSIDNINSTSGPKFLAPPMSIQRSDAHLLAPMEKTAAKLDV